VISNPVRVNFKFRMLNEVRRLKFPAKHYDIYCKSCAWIVFLTITSVYLAFIDQQYFLSLEASIPKILLLYNKQLLKNAWIWWNIDICHETSLIYLQCLGMHAFFKSCLFRNIIYRISLFAKCIFCWYITIWNP
jgi:hypothetical protein